MKCRIEIAGECVIGTQGSDQVVSTSLDEFVRALRSADRETRIEVVPDNVRFVARRGAAAVIVVEEKPQLRTVRWLDDSSPTEKGSGAIYRTARLAFPFIVLVLTFRGNVPTGYQQCFFGARPLESTSDELLLPCLYNVADKSPMKCWLCMQLPDVAGMPLTRQVTAIADAFWGSAWNKSYERGGIASYWQSRPADPRLADVGRWEEESRRDAFFPLSVEWKRSGLTVADVVGSGLHEIAPERSISNTEQLLALLAHDARPRRDWLRRLGGGE